MANASNVEGMVFPNGFSETSAFDSDLYFMVGKTSDSLPKKIAASNFPFLPSSTAIPVIANNLITQAAGKALDATQGYILKSMIDNLPAIPEIANNLTTQVPGKALDAYQGFILSKTINTIFFKGDETMSFGLIFSQMQRAVSNIKVFWVQNTLNKEIVFRGQAMPNRDILAGEEIFIIDPDRISIPANIVFSRNIGNIFDYNNSWKSGFLSLDVQSAPYIVQSYGVDLSDGKPFSFELTIQI
jgi:fructose-specific component phosphotransferase system IIB-like protein